MNFNKNEFTLLSWEQVFGKQRIDVIKRLGAKCAVTDFAILLGASLDTSPAAHLYAYLEDDSSLKGRTGLWWTSTVSREGYVFTSNDMGYRDEANPRWRYVGIRPIMPYSDISDISSNLVEGKNGVFEVTFGEYPQYVVNNFTLRLDLEKKFRRGELKKTGKTYTTNSRYSEDLSANFKTIEHYEYEFNGKKYVRVPNMNKYNGKLSNDESYYDAWIEVAPITWLVDEKAKLLVSKKIIASGVRFCDKEEYYRDFEDTEVYMFLNKYFAKDIVPSIIEETVMEEQYENDNLSGNVQKKVLEEKEEIELETKLENPYVLNFEDVSEEDIIRGAIESGVAVFLHGPSSEGKSARVKQIDPNCEIIYLRNATPDSLNGKSVYNSQTGEMIDVKPSWLKKLEEKCEKEPDRFHIVFFDEITNALPSIQGIAFNIVLDREVNGIWKLPDNARIVATGNDMNDSLAANRLAEPLFNRFAHVYIKTTTESWLRWASENNIHPAIYSYIAYTKGRVLRSEYDGERPNADPRKWEMASKMLYKTGNPEMLRALVGEDITREFVQFCKQKVITLDDVINERYNYRYLQMLNTAERYATIIGLSQVSENNLEVVRNFVKELGKEFEAIFDALWVHGDEERLEKLAEVKLSEGWSKTR